ncbi:MAG: 50S ribosomal protein L29 [Candidatus Altiarchaeota archaeon]
MAILRYKEILDMSSEDLEAHLSELRRDLMKIRGVIASGGVPEDAGKVRAIKRTIARILTHKKISENKISKER